MILVHTDSIGHDAEPTDEDNVNIGRVAAYAQTLGLHGVFILSPRCPSCGALHGFRMQTDIMPNIESEGTEVATLLQHFAEMAVTMQPRYLDEIKDN